MEVNLTDEQLDMAHKKTLRAFSNVGADLVIVFRLLQ